MVDVETDGPIPGDYSMTELGVVLVRQPLETAPRFYGKLEPISEKWDPEALKVTKRTREETLQFDDPTQVLLDFEDFVNTYNVGKRPLMISDNNGYDYMFLTWYMYHFLGRSPFKHTSSNLGSLYKGLTRSVFSNFKPLRVTKHTHNPVDDSMGNAEALIHMKEKLGLTIPLE
jgi:hypothetical protein